MIIVFLKTRYDTTRLIRALLYSVLPRDAVQATDHRSYEGLKDHAYEEKDGSQATAIRQ